MESDLLSSNDITNILKNRFNNDDIEFIRFELKPISEDAEGFLGEHYNLIIYYKLNNMNASEIFFMKTKPRKNYTQIELCNEYNAYPSEIFIYDVLIKKFEKFGYDTSFASKCYYTIPNKTLIMENLTRKGYILSERLIPFDLSKIKSLLKALALYHAAGLAYQETIRKEFGSFDFKKEYKEIAEEKYFVFFTNSTHVAMKWWNSSFKTIDRIIDLLPESEFYKANFKKMFFEFPFGKVFTENTKLAKTCGHGDLWSNNMMFKYEKNTVTDCCLIDFQICRYFYPCFDVILAIFANTSAEFRKVHLDELYEYYYNTVSENLNKYGYSIKNILPLNDFYESIRLTKADALLQVLCAIFVLYLPKQILSDGVKGDNETCLHDLFYNNSDLCCKMFINNNNFRNIITDLIVEMKDALLALQ